MKWCCSNLVECTRVAWFKIMSHEHKGCVDWLTLHFGFILFTLESWIFLSILRSNLVECWKESIIMKYIFQDVSVLSRRLMFFIIFLQFSPSKPNKPVRKSINCVICHFLCVVFFVWAKLKPEHCRPWCQQGRQDDSWLTFAWAMIMKDYKKDLYIWQ